ncbi:MAG: RNA polymerase sigma factor [Mycobacteriales bacterium]
MVIESARRQAPGRDTAAEPAAPRPATGTGRREPAETADDRLIEEARRGDARAFEALVHRHTARLFRTATRILGSREDAEDCVQNAWLSAWRALPGYRREAAPTTWLYRIVTNESLMLIRRRKPTVPIDGTEAIVDRSRLGDERRVDDREVVHRSLRRLSPGYRAVVVLREFESLSYDEIAAVLGITPTAVRNRLHRARLQLLTLLEEWR